MSETSVLITSTTVTFDFEMLKSGLLQGHRHVTRVPRRFLFFGLISVKRFVFCLRLRVMSGHVITRAHPRCCFAGFLSDGAVQPDGGHSAQDRRRSSAHHATRPARSVRMRLGGGYNYDTTFDSHSTAIPPCYDH